MFSIINNILALIKNRIAQFRASIVSIEKLLKAMRAVGLNRFIWIIDTCEIAYGHRSSFIQKTSINAAGEPIPWYTYPAIEYLNQLDFSDKVVFEYGCGNSSLFWADKSGTIRSVESNKEWYMRIKKELKANQEILFMDKKDDYINSIFLDNKNYDIIIIDGEFRMQCSQAAVNCLAPGGFIILDNSDWFPKTAHFLRTMNLIQVDLSGFGPINYYTWTTSLFFRRDVIIKARADIQPEHPIGSRILTIANE